MLRAGLETVEQLFSGTRSREQLSERDLFSERSPVSLKHHRTYRLDLSDELSMPSVIIPDDGDAEDLFATVATYYQEQSPISAMVHVLTKSTMHLFRAEANGHLHTQSLNRASRRACLGAAVGEATLAGLSVIDSAAASYAVCRRTLAFSLCRAAILYGSDIQTGDVAARWVRLRRLTGMTVASAVEEVVVLAHSHIRRLTEGSKSPLNDRIAEAMHEFIVGSDHEGTGFLTALKNLYPKSESHLIELRGVFDGRMGAFSKLAEIIRESSHDVRTNEVAVAFLCNQILPGSFAHAGALARLVDIFPGALIWYGVFSACIKGTNSPEPGTGLMDKLERDLLKPFSFEERPSCDISFEELDVLSRGSLRPESVRPTQQRVVLVGLLPGVDLFTRLGSDPDTISEQVRLDSEAEHTRRRVADLLEQALFTLRKPSAPRLDLPPAHRRHRKD